MSYPTRRRWRLKYPGGGDHAHVIPIRDTGPHVCNTHCPCGPAHEVLERGSLTIHQAWDRREVIEQVLGGSKETK